MIKIYVTSINPFKNNVLYNQAYDSLSEERKEKADALKSDLKKRQSVAAGWLLGYVQKNWKKEFIPEKKQKTEIGQEAEKRHQPEKERKQEKGQQSETETELYTNLSHSGVYAACIVGDSAVGIDIERVRTFREGIVRKCFSASEQSLIEAATSTEERDELFTRIWTRKESIAKLTKEGIARIMRRRNLEEDASVYTKSFRIETSDGIYYMTAASYTEELPIEYDEVEYFIPR